MSDAIAAYTPYWPFYAVVLVACAVGVAYTWLDGRRHR